MEAESEQIGGAPTLAGAMCAKAGHAPRIRNDFSQRILFLSGYVDILLRFLASLTPRQIE